MEERWRTWQELVDQSTAYEVNTEGVQELAAAVIERAYEDLIRAMRREAGILLHDKSYNANREYLSILKECERYTRTTLNRIDRINKTSGRPQHEHTEEEKESLMVEREKELLTLAQGDKENLINWFRSERFKDFAYSANGEWFVRQAKEHMKAYVLDQKDSWHLLVHHWGEDKSNNAKAIERRVKKWKAARDAWRKKHSLEEVKDDAE